MVDWPNKRGQDEFDEYCRGDPIIPAEDCENLFQWWWNNRGPFPTLHQYALDTLAVSAMAVECKRAFSSAKKMITPERNRSQGKSSRLANV